MKTIYITKEQAIDTHRKTILYSGGGDCNIINEGYLCSALEHIQNDKDLLRDIIHSIIEGELDFDLELKSHILCAIDNGMCGFDEQNEEGEKL